MKRIVFALLLVSMAMAYDIELFIPQFGEDELYAGIAGSDSELQSFWSMIIHTVVPDLNINLLSDDGDVLPKTHHSLLFTLVCCSFVIASIILTKRKCGGEIYRDNTESDEVSGSEDDEESGEESSEEGRCRVGIEDSEESDY